MATATGTSIREGHHHIVITLDTPQPFTDICGRTRDVHGLRLTWNTTPGRERFTAVVEFRDSASLVCPVETIPDWMQAHIDQHAPTKTTPATGADTATDIEPADAPQEQQVPASPVVWILSKGIIQEGGEIVDVYQDRQLALGDFLIHAGRITATDGKIYDPRANDDGSLHLSGAYDWLSLEPHAVRTKQALNT